MIPGLELMEEIHAGADDTCYSSILTTWEEKPRYGRLGELMPLLCRGVDVQTAINQLHVTPTDAKALLKDYERTWMDRGKRCTYDHMPQTSTFLDQYGEMIFTQAEDVYCSLNSFYGPGKAGSNVRHTNAMVLNFNYYEDDRFMDWEAERFYKKKIKDKFPFLPIAIMDSGRGLYVVYAFQHCSYHMGGLYRAIMKTFYIRFKELCIDAGAVFITQMIRLPGMIDSKSGRQVRVLQYKDTDYRIQDFVGILPWTQEEVEQHRPKKKEEKKPEKEVKKDVSTRKPCFKDFHEDIQKLIILRSHNGQYEGYREVLLYLVRERAVWLGYIAEEPVELAKKLGKEMHDPVTIKEIEDVCRPSPGQETTSVIKVIGKLGITTSEQKKLKILKRKRLKRFVYARKKCKDALMDLTPKQQELLERRARAYGLKNVLHLKNKDIDDVLEIDKSTITRDLQHIKQYPSRFKILLKDHMGRLQGRKETDDYRLCLAYQGQEHPSK